MCRGRMLVLGAVLVGACGPPETLIVHATDPHIFEEPGRGRRLTHEPANRAALRAMIREIATIDGANILVITGDFGLDRTWTTDADPVPGTSLTDTTRHRRAAQVDSIATILAELAPGPVRDIYVIPGNNDLALESPRPADLAYINGIFSDVATALADHDIVLHDLSACYADGASNPAGCVADVAGSDLRFVGFPSYSFKNNEDAPPDDPNEEYQDRQLAEFAQAVSDAHRNVLLSHIPALDDPYSGDPAWGVSADILTQWRDVVDGAPVVAVLAGHFHDYRRDRYVRPYSWSTVTTPQPNANKLLVAPPLAIKNQTDTPAQARGFALVRLRERRVTRRIYWYDAGRDAFDVDDWR